MEQRIREDADVYNKNMEMMHHSRRMIDNLNRRIETEFDQMRISVPPHIKNATIGRLRELGVEIHYEPSFHIILPASAFKLLQQEEEVKKHKVHILEKLKSTEEQHKRAIEMCYDNLISQVPDHIRYMTLGELREKNAIEILYNPLRSVINGHAIDGTETETNDDDTEMDTNAGKHQG